MTTAETSIARSRKSDWRDTMACRKEDPELFFPNGTTGLWALQIEQAKAVCRRCPSRGACLAFALDENIDDGIFGGFTERERRALRRKASRAAAANDTDEEPPQPLTLGEAWKARTRPLGDGHLGWSGSNCLYFQGVSYTPNRSSFIASRGRQPHGQVMAHCGVGKCVRPDHLTDALERDERAKAGNPVPNPRQGPCGTRSARQRHIDKGEPIDELCRTSYNAMQARYVRTGTTKVTV